MILKSNESFSPSVDDSYNRSGPLMNFIHTQEKILNAWNLVKPQILLNYLYMPLKNELVLPVVLAQGPLIKKHKSTFTETKVNDALGDPHQVQSS